MPFKSLPLSTRHPVLSWANHPLGDQERKMAENVANLPFVFKHVSLMPDVHLGIGALVGSVVATQKAIIPAAVGVDIGCGMMAVETNVKISAIEGKWRNIRLAIEQAIPVGFSEHKEALPKALQWEGWQSFKHLHDPVQDLSKKAVRQLGSLGGGNHFIEICYDKSDKLWIMLHSGSRHIGNALAASHIKSAKHLLKLSEQKVPDPDLAWFIYGTREFESYWHDLQWAQSYARTNRELMMDLILDVLKGELSPKLKFRPVNRINCHHNYAEREVHFGESVFVTRKGAVRAAKGDFGIIPGSMGAKSFIVRGLGNANSFHSCSHGAGRQMSRTQAKKQFSTADLSNQTDGVECRKDKGVVDEIPAAYKNIDDIINQQSDLVEIVAELKQVICVKG